MPCVRRYSNAYSQCAWVLQQSNATSSNGTLPGVLPDQRIVVTSTGLQTDGGNSANITGASAYDRISSIEDDALGTNIVSPYKRLIRCYIAMIMIVITVYYSCSVCCLEALGGLGGWGLHAGLHDGWMCYC